MERKRDILPLWLKIQGGNLKLVHRRGRIKFKEKVRITEEELGKYRDQFKLLENGTGDYKVSKEAKLGLPEQPPSTAQPADKDEYNVEHVGGGWYNVISGSGKVMNETKLKSADAEELKSQLEEETVEQ